MAKQHESWKGAVAGAIGGIAASWIMNQFQAAWMLSERGFSRGHGAQSAKTEGPDDPTTRVAEAIVQRPLNPAEKEVAGQLIHYAYGGAMGAVYGALAEAVPATAAGYGAAMGAVVWLVSDLGLLPGMGLSRRSDEYPTWIHLYSLSSHLVYGTATEAARRGLRRVLR